jgi:hypothetical protein
MTSQALRRSVAILLFGAAIVAVRTSAQRATVPAPPPNFDIRVTKTAEAVSYLTRFTAPSTDAVAAAARLTTLARLQAAFPDLVIENSPETGVPEIVGLPPARGFLTGPTTDRAGALRTFLASNAAVYGLTPQKVAELNLVADYANPAGNMAWVEFEQRVNGLPVFGGLLRGGFTAAGELVRTTGQLGADLDPALLPSAPAISATQAIGYGAASVNWVVRGKTADDDRAWLVYFPLSPGIAPLAWAVQIWGDPDAFLILVDAFDGTVLFRKNLTNYQSQAVTYHVYNDDSPAPMSPSTTLPGPGTQAPFISRSMITLIGNEGPNTFNNLGWINDGLNVTDGNNVEAGLDRNGVDGVDAPVTGSSFRVFNFSYNPAPGNPPPGDNPLTGAYQNGEVAHAFYWTNLFHDKLYLLGFTEAARNFQNDNFGRGGLAADRIRAEIQDSSGVNNANFTTPGDGSRGRMQMYIFTGPTPARPSGLDTEVLIHELTHGTSQRLHNNGVGLTTTMAGGMGEGWSDLYARALLSTADEDINGRYAYGAWVSAGLNSQTDNYYYGFRRFPYALMGAVGANGKPHNPLTFADIDPTQINLTNGAYAPSPIVSGAANQVHNAGEVWASALLEVRARMIGRLGFAAGNQHFLQIVTDGMKLDPINPTYVQGRDAILAAVTAGGGDVVADVNDVWAGFAVRGMGYSAQVLDAATSRVIEAFDIPGLAGNGGTIVAESIPNGWLDSGETVTLSLCITNTAAATSGTITGTLFASGGVLSPSGPQSYGTVAPAGNVCRTFSLVVGPTCGGTMTATLQAQEIGGGGQTRNLTYAFTVGQAFLSQNFDGVTAPALPAGWTTSTLGGSVNLWATTTSSIDTPPNRAFVNNPSTISDNVLDSPSVAVPAGSSYVSFRNRYQTSNVFDGGVLEISINGGAFADIIAAGGAFLAGGYNTTIATGFGNPIGGRQAWSGFLANYVTSTVALPPAAAGQNAVLRWRMATDSGGSGTGWGIDTVVASQCGSQAPVITTQPQSQTVMSGRTATLTVVAAGASPLGYQWYQGASGDTSNPIGGATLSSYTTPALVAPASYWVRVSNGVGMADSNTAALTIGPAANVNLITNGDFSAGETGWSLFEEPDIVHNVTGGVFQYYRANPTTTASGQATIFQVTGQPIAAASPLTATFSIGNSSTARKRISVLMLDSDFSDLSVCTFWLAPGAPMRTYYMIMRPTKPWANAAMYFYAATKGQDGGFYQLDNVTLRYSTNTALAITQCGDPTVPANDPFGVASGNLIGNGQFLGDTLAPWSTFGSLTWQIDGGIFEFYRPSPLPTPAGVIFQNTGQAMAANTIMTATLLLGNSTSVRRRVTVLLQESDFSDLTACTFWLAPYQPLGTYTIRGFTTKPWVNATLSVYAASVGTQTWMRLGNVTLARTPAAQAEGTTCIEPAPAPLWDPGRTSQPAAAQLSRYTTTARSAPSYKRRT